MYKTDPLSTSDMVFGSDTTQSTLNAILSRRLPFPQSGKNSLLLYGSFGTGKTTYAPIFCKEFEQAIGDPTAEPFVETIACDSTAKIDAILKRCERIRSLVPQTGSYHYFVFDEVDNLTSDAQQRLKSFLNHSNIICVLTTNYVQKVDKGLRDRCYQLAMNAASDTQIALRVHKVLSQNQMRIDDNALNEIISNSDGSMRDIVPIALAAAVSLKRVKPTKALRVVK